MPAADAERPLLFISVGFFAALWLMCHFVSLRPAGAKSLSSVVQTAGNIDESEDRVLRDRYL